MKSADPKSSARTRPAVGRSHRLILLLLVWVAAVSLSVCRADDDEIPPGTPADVAAIMQKMKGGTPPTGADIQRLQEWGRQMEARAGLTAGSQFAPTVPGQKPGPEGIPARVTVTLHYNMKSDLSSGTFDVEGSADSMLFANINGNGDYLKSELDPSVGISTFRFEPLKEGGSGGGTVHTFDTAPKGTDDIKGHFTKTQFGILLVTTGTDLLFASGGGFGGIMSGHAHHTWHGDPPTDENFTDVVLDCPVDSPFADEARYQHDPDLLARYKVGMTSPQPAMNLSYSKLVAAIQSDGAEPVTAHETFDFVEHGERYTGSSTISIQLRPQPMELVIEPTDEKTYEDWLPMPDLKDGGNKEIFGDPKPFSVHVALVKRGSGGKTGPTKPDADVGGKILFTLHDVSQHMGVTMNTPAWGKGDTRPDLFFLPQADQPAGIHVVDESHVETDSDAVEATVLVGARDTGAYGQIEARIDSLGIVSVNRRNSKNDLTLPLDENENHIADKWERDEGIFKKNLDPTWDEEDEPAGMITKGNSLSLFDQYRGFVVAKDASSETFQRIPPKKKSLFVFLAGPDRALYRKGVAEYAVAARNLPVYEIFSPNRLAQGDDGNAAFPRWLNFNQTPYSIANVDVVWIEDFDQPWDATEYAQHGYTGHDKNGLERRNVDGSVDPGVTFGTLPDAAYSNNRMSPKTTRRINISRVRMNLVLDTIWRKMLAYPPIVQSAHAADVDLTVLARQLATIDTQKALMDRLVVFCVMHELGHATGAAHHDPDYKGDVNCPMRYWYNDPVGCLDLVLFLSGKWDLTVTPEGTPWRFCDSDWSYMTLKP